MTNYGRELAAGFAVTGGALCVVYAASPSETVQHLCIALTGLAAGIAMIVGPVLHRPPVWVPWVAYALSIWAFLIGALLRSSVDPKDTLALLVVNLITGAGYLLTAAGMVIMLRYRRRLERHVLSDAVIVSLGAAVAVFSLFVRPALNAGLGATSAGVVGIYPFFDVLLLLLLLNLAFTTDLHLPAFRSFVLGLSGLFVGDIGYSWIARSGNLVGGPNYDLPFICGYAGLAYMSLHPSMTRLTKVTSGRRVQAWAPGRLLLIGAATAAPLAVLFFDDDRTVRLFATLALAGIMLTVLQRAASAVRGMTRAQRASEHMATHDRLTGLPNRLMLVERIEVALAGHRRGEPPVWLVLIGLDGLNAINDSWGHETGDQVVQELAHRFARDPELSPALGMVASDVFAVLVNVEESELDGVVARIHAHLAPAVEMPGVELSVTASLGIAEAGLRSSGEAVLRNADTAMYRARATRRGGVVRFDVAMREHVRTRLELEHELRRALERDELWLAYQPIVDIGTEQISGAEALVRWAHPVRGFVPPNDFIPIAEETGLIGEIGAWVLQESVRQLGVWRREGLVDESFFLSVNASTHQLRDDSLLRLAVATLKEHEVAPEALVIEITESVMMQDELSDQAATDLLTGFREAGIRLSVDDFGTGYSSLGYLSRFPVTGVKVDRAFVSALDGDEQNEAIVRAIAAMARALHLSVVAEGVETTYQRDVLRALGVDFGQGWLWAKAMPPEEFRATRLLPRQRTADRPLQAGVGNSQA